MPIPCILSSRDEASRIEKLKQPIRSLSSQIKRMALKGLSAYRHCAPCRRYSTDQLAKFRGSISSGEGTTAVDAMVVVEEREPEEWVAQVEHGVVITFVSLPGGTNDLKRIRFRREMFDKWKAQKWWAQNSENVMELYNVKRQTSLYLCGPKECTQASNSDRGGTRTRTQTGSFESEWSERDAPGVYITIGALLDGGRRLKSIRFRREKFSEVEARMWWGENRERIHKQYL